METYNRQKELAMGLGPGALTKGKGREVENAEGSGQVRLRITFFLYAGADARLQLIPSTQEQQLAREALYRDANTLLYGDNKPSEEAIDRVVSKLNQEYVIYFYYSRPSKFTNQPSTALISEANSLGNGLTRRRVTSLTSTNATASSTRRYVGTPAVASHSFFKCGYALIPVRCTDRSVLRQVHGRNPRKLRARYGALIIQA
jgi:hypothetical protein